MLVMHNLFGLYLVIVLSKSHHPEACQLSCLPEGNFLTKCDKIKDRLLLVYASTCLLTVVPLKRSDQALVLLIVVPVVALTHTMLHYTLVFISSNKLLT